jgi:hypothetical protein
MFIQSFILCIIAIYIVFYKNKKKINYYTKIDNNQQKVLLLSNIINFRNSLLNYCNSKNLTDLINEIKNNDLIYYDQLFKIKKKIDIYYKLRLNTNYTDSNSDSYSNINSDSDSDSNSDSDIDIDNTDIDNIKTEIKEINTEIKDINTYINDINTDIKDISSIIQI